MKINQKSKISKAWPSKFAKNQNRPQSGSGFTLIEVLVASAILVVLAFGFLGLQYIIGQNQVSVWRDYLSLNTTNSAVSTMVKELRNSQESGAGTYPLETANDQEITFYCDYDYDGDVERVRYSLSGSVLSKGIIEPTGSPATYPTENENTRVVSDIIRNGGQPVFYYYNADWPEDTVNNPLLPENRISDTKTVKVSLLANPNASDSENDYLLESSTNIRTFLTQ
jgi:prepilin-type N-terminal cleavage/methylation domain-containing protein